MIDMIGIIVYNDTEEGEPAILQTVRIYSIATGKVLGWRSVVGSHGIKNSPMG